MKTTIELADSLLIEVKQAAASEGTTVRALVEKGLRQLLAQRRQRAAPFKLRRAAFKGKGLRPELQDPAWDRLRELAYEGRGS